MVTYRSRITIMTSVSYSTLKKYRYWKLTFENIHKRFFHYSHGSHPRLCNKNSVMTLMTSRIACLMPLYNTRSSTCSWSSHLNDRGCISKKLHNSVKTSTLVSSQPVFSQCKQFHFPHHGKRLASISTDENHFGEVEMIVNEILKATRELDVMAESLSKEAVKNLVKTLQTQDFDKRKILKLLSRRLWLLERPAETANLTNLLLLHDLTHSTVCHLIGAIPYNLQNSLDRLPEIINNAIFFFASLGVSERDAMFVFNACPSVLYLDLKIMGIAVSRLKSIFSAKDVVKLLKKSPNVLAENWSEILRKYNYTIFRMVYNNDDIVKSRLFSHTFDHIRNRHIFLVRAGIFVAFSHKLDPALNPNPKLKDVVDTSDSTFLKIFPIIDLDDFHTFCEMRALEQEAEDDGLDEDTDGDIEMDVEGTDDESESESVTVTDYNDYRTKDVSKRKQKNNLNYKRLKFK